MRAVTKTRGIQHDKLQTATCNVSDAWMVGSNMLTMMCARRGANSSQKSRWCRSPEGRIPTTTCLERPGAWKCQHDRRSPGLTDSGQGLRARIRAGHP
jgi:hypothetical protein